MGEGEEGESGDPYPSACRSCSDGGWEVAQPAGSRTAAVRQRQRFVAVCDLVR